ncbi:hypothetical protein EXE55_03885 [Burkholderia glumae]|nr:hypothetical protein EXE55_03885 [Burkholderia glumae]
MASIVLKLFERIGFPCRACLMTLLRRAPPFHTFGANAAGCAAPRLRPEKHGFGRKNRLF